MRPAVAHATTINVASFSMAFPGRQFVNYNSGSIPGLAYNTLYYVYANDPALMGGNLTYNVSTTKETALEELGNEFIGSITTPRQGAADTIGNNDGGAGGQYGMLSILNMELTPQANVAFGTFGNPQNAVDNDQTTFATLTANVPGAGATQTALQVVSPPGLIQATQSATLKVKVSLPTNSASPSAPSFYALLVQYGLQGVTPNTNGVILNPTTLVSIPLNGTTLAPTIYSVALPKGQNLASIVVQVNVETANTQTSGQVVANFYEAWIELTQ